MAGTEARHRDAAAVASGIAAVGKINSAATMGNDGHEHGGKIDAPRPSLRYIHAHRCHAVDLPDCSDPARDGGGVAMTGFCPCQLIKIKNIIVK